MQYDHVGRPLSVNVEPIKGKQHPITALLLGLKGSEFLEGLKDSDVIARHQMQAYYTASCRNAGRTKALYEYVGLWSSSLVPSSPFLSSSHLFLSSIFLSWFSFILSLSYNHTILTFITLFFDLLHFNFSSMLFPFFFYLALSRSIISFLFLSSFSLLFLSSFFLAPSTVWRQTSTCPSDHSIIDSFIQSNLFS